MQLPSSLSCSPIESSAGVSQPSQFVFQASGKAFKSICDTLYSNKIRAVMRELSANALDAHVMAGKQDVPFEIHLPSLEEPYLSIKDFGPGLSREFMMSRYTAVFNSTKDSSNDFIGGFGIGRLSALAYGDSYLCTSIHSGVKTTYSVGFNETGCPDLRIINEEQTQDGSGFEVKIAVEVSDFQEFFNEARFAYQLYDVKPNFVSHPDFAVRQMEYPLVFSNWKLRGENGGGARAIIGTYAYPIDSMPKGLSKLATNLYSANVDIAFEIGELEIALSREKLSFNQQTLDAIATRLNAMGAELETWLTAQVAKETSPWKASALLRDVWKKFPFCRAQGQKVMCGSGDLVPFDAPAKPLKDAGFEVMSFTKGGRRGKMKTNDVETVSAYGKRPLFIIEKRVPLARMRKYLADNGYTGIDAVYVVIGDKKRVAEILKLDNDDYLTVDNLPVIHRASSGSAAHAGHYLLNLSPLGADKIEWDGPLPQGAWTLSVSRGEIESSLTGYSYGSNTASELRTLVSALQKATGREYPIYLRRSARSVGRGVTVKDANREIRAVVEGYITAHSELIIAKEVRENTVSPLVIEKLSSVVSPPAAVQLISRRGAVCDDIVRIAKKWNLPVFEKAAQEARKVREWAGQATHAARAKSPLFDALAKHLTLTTIVTEDALWASVEAQIKA